jgi:hypothetical protein
MDITSKQLHMALQRIAELERELEARRPEVVALHWRPHVEKPATTEPVTALLAIDDPEEQTEPRILAGIYLWRGGQWVNEETFKPCAEPFWWVFEDELIRTLPSPQLLSTEKK